MSKQVAELYKDKELERIVKTICHGNDLYKDLLQELFLQILETPPKILDRTYIIKAALNIWNDKSRRFKNRYEGFRVDVKEYISATNSSEVTECSTFQINYCISFFGTVSPELLILSKELYKMEKEAIEKGRFPLDKELVYLYTIYKSSNRVQKDVGVSAERVQVAIRRLKQRIHENINRTKETIHSH